MNALEQLHKKYGGELHQNIMLRKHLIEVIAGGLPRTENPRKSQWGLLPNKKGVYSVRFIDSDEVYYGASISEGVGKQFKASHLYTSKNAGRIMHRINESKSHCLELTVLITDENIREIQDEAIRMTEKDEVINSFYPLSQKAIK